MSLLDLLRISLVSLLFFTSVSGNCDTPKVRREWRTLSSDERAAWISAIKCLAQLPHNPRLSPIVDPALSLIPPVNPNSSYFDDIAYSHMDLNVLIHNTGFFLPWHRLIVQIFEEEMSTKCGYDGTQPYWDWTQDTADFYNSPVWSGSEYDGIGTWGDPDNDYQIFDGALKDLTVVYPVPHHIRRNYSIQPFLQGRPAPDAAPPISSLSMKMTEFFTNGIVDFLVNSFTGDYINFQQALENLNGPHPAVHEIIGGDMAGKCPFGLEPPRCYFGPKWASNDPTFFLHHSMLDKIWHDWQNRDPSNKYAFAGGSVSWQVNKNQSFAEYPNGAPPWVNLNSVIPNNGLWYYNYTVGDVIDTTGGKLCYVYA